MMHTKQVVPRGVTRLQGHKVSKDHLEESERVGIQERERHAAKPEKKFMPSQGNQVHNSSRSPRPAKGGFCNVPIYEVECL